MKFEFNAKANRKFKKRDFKKAYVKLDVNVP